MSQIRDQIVTADNETDTYDAFTALIAASFYIVIGYVCLDIVFAISLHYVAESNDPNTVAGLGLAYTLVNIIVIPISLGANQSLNVHSSQALGAQKPKLAQTFFSMTILIHLMFIIPISIILILLKPIIALTIPEEDREPTSYASQIYLYYLLPSTLLAMTYEGLKCYMMSFKIFKIFMFITVFTTTLHILWCYLFVKVLNIGGGIHGAGLAILLTEVLNCLFCLITILLTDYKVIAFQNYQFKFNIHKEIKLFWSYFKNSLPLMISISADLLIFFMFNFIAISFGSVQFNAQLGLSNTSNCYFKFPFALSMALMTFIGNEMGSRNVSKAKFYAWIGLLIYLSCTIVFTIILTIFKYEWANFYSANNQEVTDLILEVYPIFAFGFFFIDGFQGTLSGILKGIDKKEFVSYSTSIDYYLFGLPLAFYFSCNLNGYGLYKKVYGIWLSFAITNFVLSTIFLIENFLTNWDEMSQRICHRVEQQHNMQKIEDCSILEYDDEIQNLQEDENEKQNKF